MNCRNCGTPNPEGTAFCINCGTAFAEACSVCGVARIGNARFCGNCGTRFPDNAPAAVVVRPARQGLRPLVGAV